MLVNLAKKGKMNNISMWHFADQPREKLYDLGRRQMTNTELIAILLNAGNKKYNALALAQQILKKYNYDLQKLSNAPVDELTQFYGIGKVKAIYLHAALELALRLSQYQKPEKVKIKSIACASQIALDMLRALNHEECWALLLDNANHVIKKIQVSKGGISATVVDVRLILKACINCYATKIILAHNHPSGNLNPSNADLEFTNKVKEAALLMDIQLLDHIIIAEKNYFSFAEKKLL